MTGSEGTGRTVGRRAVIAAAGAAGLTTALTACGESGGEKEEGPAKDVSAPEAGGDGGSGGEGGSGGAGGAVLAKTSDIPEGGGMVFKDQKVVVTQPTAGEFKAFSAICTHQGCPVKDIKGDVINCPCHNSNFSVTDGSVKSGPAKKPLPPAKITVDGDSIKLA
ncbi:Rieske (2Fe-2S) protein [Streptomyces sp. 8N706]|uniref:Rieske (2Fe-2S) protein n=1 Tax=Streptomyces sp. 8N706 TaxID=3457416 RepID=UPI003FCFE8E1